MSLMVAIMDLGSNSVKMTISRVENSRAETVKKFRETVRLSEGMGKNNTISETASERALDAIEFLKNKAESYGCSYIHIVATAALRRAENKQNFIDSVSKLGLELRILTEEEEAYYGFLGVQTFTSLTDYVIMDVGGGSSEVSLIKNGTLQNTLSVPYGAVILSEKVAEENLEDFIRAELQKIDFINQCRNLKIIGLGGTADAACSVLDKTEITYSELIDVYEKIKNTPLPDRGNIHGVPSDRGDVILSGVTIIKAFAEMISAPALQMCKKGIRDGILKEGYL